jgi:hypothetical protein
MQITYITYHLCLVKLYKIRSSSRILSSHDGMSLLIVYAMIKLTTFNSFTEILFYFIFWLGFFVFFPAK